LGGSSWDYSFSGALEGLNVVVSLDDTGNCNVTVNDESCESCVLCAALVDTSDTVLSAETFTAHCTNVDQGRHVQCEAVSPIFFPLVATYGETAATPTDNSPVSSPVAAPGATAPSPAASGAVAGVVSKFAAFLLLLAMTN
jgi:hypothetical protein